MKSGAATQPEKYETPHKTDISHWETVGKRKENRMLFERISKLMEGKKTLKNILSIGVLRGGNILIQLLLIPVSIKFISADSYGLWLTLSSMVTWLNIMDVGLSNGLRNKITEANAVEDLLLGKTYVSTTYGLLSIISVVGFGICIACIYLFDWRNMLNIPKDISYGQFQILLLIIASSFFLTFLLKPIASVSYALHRPFIEYLVLLLSNAVNLGCLYLLVHFKGHGSITELALVFCFTPIVATFILTIYFFKNHFSDLKPSFATVNFKYARELMSLSGKFFVIQIAATLIFTANNFLIAHYIGNADVTVYNIAYRYFNTVIILQGMILVPFWAIFTESYHKKEIAKMKENMNKLLKSTVVLGLGTAILLLVSRYAYSVWLKDAVTVPYNLSFWMSIYTLLLMISSVYTTFINGTGRIKLQMITATFTSILHIPVAILLITVFHLNVIGLIITSSLWLALTIPLRIIQYRKLISSTELSIWTK